MLARFPIVAASLLYLAAASYQITLPGLNYDEAADVVPALLLLQGRPTEALATVEAFGRDWPLMILHYVGPTSTYLSLPFLAIGGPGVVSVRAMEIAVGLVGLWVLYGLVAELFDRSTAALAALLLAISPSFVFWSRIGIMVSSPLQPLALGSLWALWRWRTRRQDRYLALAALLAGVGLTTKLLFLWWVLAVLAAAIVLAVPRRLRTGHSPAPRLAASSESERDPTDRLTLERLAPRPAALGVASFCFVLGALPLLWHNLRGGETVSLVARNLVRTELRGVDNLDVLNNLAFVARGALEFFSGSTFDPVGPRFAAPWAEAVFLGAVVVLAVLALRQPHRLPLQRLAFLVLVVAAVVFQSAFTITGLSYHHLYLLFGLPQTVLAVLFWSAWRAERATLARAAALGAVLALVAAHGLSIVRYHDGLARTGGVGLFSSEIDRLAADLLQAGITRPVAMDWGFRKNLQLLTAGAVNPDEAFEYSQQPSERLAEYARYLLGEPTRRYLFHAEGHTQFRGHLDRLREAAEETHRSLVVERTYSGSDGEPLYLVYRAEEAPRRFAVPPTATPVGVRLGDAIQLAAFELDGGPSPTVRAGDAVRLRLYWQALRSLSVDYVVFTHLEAPDGRSAGQKDNDPVTGHYPTSRWAVGEVVMDPYRIPVRADAAPGAYRLVVGLYERASGRRLDVPGSPDDSVTLAVFEVLAPR